MNNKLIKTSFTPEQLLAISEMANIQSKNITVSAKNRALFHRIDMKAYKAYQKSREAQV